MKFRLPSILLLAALAAACASQNTQRVPTLTAPAADAPAPNTPPKRDFVKEVGDTTWNVVTAPARLVMPKKEPPKQPEVYDAPAAVFIQRNYGEEDTSPATHP
jgi:hypothetical protein